MDWLEDLFSKGIDAYKEIEVSKNESTPGPEYSNGPTENENVLSTTGSQYLMIGGGMLLLVVVLLAVKR